MFLGHGVGDGFSCVPGPQSQFDSEAMVESVEERTDVAAEIASGFVGGEDHDEQQRLGADTRFLSRMIAEEPVDFLDNRGRFQHSQDPPDDSLVRCFRVLRGSVFGIAFGFVGEIVRQSGS